MTSPHLHEFFEVADTVKKVIAFLLLLLSPTVLLARQSQSGQPNPLVFTHLTVVDVTSGQLKPDMTLVVEGVRITAVGKSDKVKVPRGAQVIDASGKFLIPGLWDMHAHSLTSYGNRREWVFPLLIANGVTGVREMGNDLPFERINQIRREVLEGKILGPRFGAATARVIDGRGSLVNPSVEVERADEARRLVREYKQHGMDFIKAYNRLSREVYLAIIDEAKRQKIPVAGHVPNSMTAAEISDLGQIIIEHNTDIFLSCSREEEKLRQQRPRALARTLPPRPADRPIRPRGPGQNPIQLRAMETYDERKAAALFEHFVRNGTWMCPTLSVSVPREGDSRLKYIPAPLQEGWRNAVEEVSRVQRADNRKIVHQRFLEVVGLMHRTGVRLLAGTDFPFNYVYPGFSLHNELALFVEAGLQPFEALQTATVNPARFLGKEEEIGTIEVGKLADLVLLEANPLEDIRNTQRIGAVVANGRLLDRKALDRLLAEAEAAAKK